MRFDLLCDLNRERAARRIAIVVIEIATGTQRLVRENEIDADALRDALKAGVLAGKSAQVEKDGRTYFVELHLPTPSMVITGAVHISQTLAPLAKMLGYQVTIIDPRTAFATPERFPDTEIVAEWPDRAFKNVSLDRRTAFIALTHEPRIDDPGLQAALSANCFYVGALGSRRTHDERLRRLEHLGIERTSLDRIHGPVGLAIGAMTPAEIAVSIMAGVTMALRKTYELQKA
jgi:xanthine dehydrogenase accessory factor